MDAMILARETEKLARLYKGWNRTRRFSDRRRRRAPAAPSSNPAHRGEASLDRGPGGNPKSSL